MLELIINTKKDEKEIELIKDDELVEYYKENSDEERNEGNIYLGIVKDVLSGMQSAFIDIGTSKKGFIHLKDLLPKIDLKKIGEKKVEEKQIKEVIKQGQLVLVQVKKDSNNLKGAKVSTHISLPSKYIVFTPNTDIITVSQKIENKEEVKRLIDLAKNNIKGNNGLIIRTSAAGKTQEVIEDIKKQEAKWENIQQKYNELKENNTTNPYLIYENESLIEKLLMDLLTKQIEQVIVNDKDDYKLIERIIKENSELKNIKLKVKNIEEVEAIHNLNKQKERLENRKIWLKSGGFITIDKTEALTAIDVNTGKYTGDDNLEETVYRVNKEATVEIAKQLRLRDIGGIIIIDYIDMKQDDNKNKIEKLLKDELKNDRTKTQVEGFTKLDLMELTRKHICSHKE